MTRIDTEIKQTILSRLAQHNRELQASNKACEAELQKARKSREIWRYIAAAAVASTLVLAVIKWLL